MPVIGILQNAIVVSIQNWTKKHFFIRAPSGWRWIFVRIIIGIILTCQSSIRDRWDDFPFSVLQPDQHQPLLHPAYPCFIIVMLDISGLVKIICFSLGLRWMRMVKWNSNGPTDRQPPSSLLDLPVKKSFEIWMLHSWSSPVFIVGTRLGFRFWFWKCRWSNLYCTLCNLCLSVFNVKFVFLQRENMN